ncbi:MAG: hypothetical protein M0C28_42595 [Candidatus Moduliflexus flocculans]|nr:hypothetical protein [Candidatus Moduliflexus flocculans]
MDRTGPGLPGRLPAVALPHRPRRLLEDRPQPLPGEPGQGRARPDPRQPRGDPARRGAC